MKDMFWMLLRKIKKQKYLFIILIKCNTPDSEGMALLHSLKQYFKYSMIVKLKNYKPFKFITMSF